jgi:hypothetical protein
MITNPAYITNWRGKKNPIDIHHQHIACVFFILKNLANFCHLVIQKKKPSATHTKNISVEKSSSKSPNFEDLFI